MNYKPILFPILLVIFGVLVGVLVSKNWDTYFADRRHWNAIERYNSSLLAGRESSIDPLPHLTSLVSAGELEHLDIIFPEVKASPEINKYWMDYVGSIWPEDIVYAAGNVEYVQFKPKGDMPLHLKIWYKESAIASIKKLFNELENLEK